MDLSEVELQEVRRRRDDEGQAEWEMPIEAFTDHLRSDENLSQFRWKQKNFYKHQNDIIRSMLEAHEQSKRGAEGLDEEEEDNSAMSRKIAIYGSVVCNVVLLILKVFAAYFSGSLSVIASALDSFLDLLSGAILFLTEYLTDKSSHEDYPAGKSRFEPVGLVIFSACMFTATLQLLLSSIETLITKDLDLMVDKWTMIVLFITIGVKFCLWMYCRTISGSEAVAALALDHRNDVVSNLFGVTTALLGYRVKWWIDPSGAIFISLYLMTIWACTGYAQLSSLTGKTAPPELLQALTFIARNHHPDIVAIDTVRAYHYGYKFMVELDIVLHPDMPLRIAHDIGEALQNKLETIEKVERAFVHLDYEWDHKPEHARCR